MDNSTCHGLNLRESSRGSRSETEAKFSKACMIWLWLLLHSLPPSLQTGFVCTCSSFFLDQSPTNTHRTHSLTTTSPIHPANMFQVHYCHPVSVSQEGSSMRPGVFVYQLLVLYTWNSV